MSRKPKRIISKMEYAAEQPRQVCSQQDVGNVEKIVDLIAGAISVGMETTLQ